MTPLRRATSSAHAPAASTTASHSIVSAFPLEPSAPDVLGVDRRGGESHDAALVPEGGEEAVEESSDVDRHGVGFVEGPGDPFGPQHRHDLRRRTGVESFGADSDGRRDGSEVVECAVPLLVGDPEQATGPQEPSAEGLVGRVDEEGSRRCGERVEAARSLLRPAELLGAEVALLDRHPGAGCELLDGVDEGQALELGEEAEAVAARATPEAVVDLLVRDDVEARRLLLVERAQPDVAVAALLELHAPLDEGDEVGPRANLVDQVPGDARHVRQPPRRSLGPAGHRAQPRRVRSTPAGRRRAPGPGRRRRAGARSAPRARGAGRPCPRSRDRGGRSAAPR